MVERHVDEEWDLVVVGAGPAGSATALGALRARPDLRVLLLDRDDFPRDKACGDGIAPHVVDALSEVGAGDVLDDFTPIEQFSLRHRNHGVLRTMRRPVWVVPRIVFDARLVEAAVGTGATLRRHRVRTIEETSSGVRTDGAIRCAVLVGADGAHSAVSGAVGLQPRRQALAIRGYAPTPPHRRGQQVIAYGRRAQPSYAWSFDRGDGQANVGYGELLDPGQRPPSRGFLLEQLESLLPGAINGGTAWRAHHLPLSSWSLRGRRGRILLAGDASGLVNPMTGEGIYYAVATGILAGVAAAEAITAGRPGQAGANHCAATRALVARHVRHTATAHRLASMPAVVTAGVRASARDQRVFDDIVELGLGRGLITLRVLAGLVRGLRP